MLDSWKVYELLMDMGCTDSRVEQVIVGKHWTLVEAEGLGLSLSPQIPQQPYPPAALLQGRPAREVAGWIRQWEPYKVALGQAALNSMLNHHPLLPGDAVPLSDTAGSSLAVFRYFYPRLLGKRVVVVGHYPGLEAALPGIHLDVINKPVLRGAMLDQFTAYTIANADWVFLSANTLANKRFPQYAELAQAANLVLMGPATPWLPELAEFGVDYLAGVRVRDEAMLRQQVIEGESASIVDPAVEYNIVDIGACEMSWIKTAIADTVARRERIKAEMEQWYATHKGGFFPRRAELQSLDRELSTLDDRFKRLWDTREMADAPAKMVGL